MKELEYLKKYLPANKLEEGITKLTSGVPVQYIIGSVNFYGFEIKVNSSVLIPRFETEELVSKLIEYIKKYFDKKVDIVDLGTGSGCIAITLSKKIASNVDAVDISRKALGIAKENAVLNNTNITLYHGDMLNPLSKKYDILVSNPPYISHDEEVMDVVKNNEPHLALYADNKGLYFYEEILKNASSYINDKNIIAFEIGDAQGNDIKDIALKYFPSSIVSIEKDMQKRDRFVFIFNNVETD